MEREPKRLIPKAARYPLFLVGLVVLIAGNLLLQASGAGPAAEAMLSAVGFLMLVVAVIPR